MAIIGHGIDIVEVGRIAAMVERHGARFLERVFTPGELGYARGRKRETEHLAARFAAKEAVLKAIGTGWRSGIGWRDVEIGVLPSGQPLVKVHGRAAEAATELGIERWVVSLTHSRRYAAASVIGEGRRDEVMK